MDTVYRMVSHDESQRNAKKGLVAENSALCCNFGKQGKFNGAGRGVVRGKSKIQCSHCQMMGHTKENCYKIIGYPSGWKSRDGTRDSGKFYADNADIVTNDSAGADDSNPGIQLSSEQIN